MPTPESQSAGFARLYAPFGCSWGGVKYDPDADDIVVVPSAAVAELLAFPPICPETKRPPRVDPAVMEREHADISRRLAVTHKTLFEMQEGLEEALAQIAARDERIAELEAQLRAAAQPAAEPKLERGAKATKA